MTSPPGTDSAVDEPDPRLTGAEMKRRTLLAALVLGLCFAPDAAAQREADDTRRPGDRVERVLDESGIVVALDSLAVAARPELERTIDEFGAALGALAARITGDRELRESGLRAALGLLDVAQIVVVEQSVLLEEAIRATAERITVLSDTTPAAPEPR
jgi:hypothetical protein